MKYAKVKGGKVIAEQSGVAPTGKGWLPVVIKWKKPTDLPAEFYLPTRTKPIYKALLDSVEEHREWSLIPLADLHFQQFQRIEAERWQKELAGFDYGGIKVPATATAQTKIPQMPKAVRSFKVGTGEFISTEDTQPLKDKLVVFVQELYEWEDAECTKVKACITHDLLEALLYPSK